MLFASSCIVLIIIISHSNIVKFNLTLLILLYNFRYVNRLYFFHNKKNVIGLYILTFSNHLNSEFNRELEASDRKKISKISKSNPFISSLLCISRCKMIVWPNLAQKKPDTYLYQTNAFYMCCHYQVYHVFH